MAMPYIYHLFSGSLLRNVYSSQVEWNNKAPGKKNSHQKYIIFLSILWMSEAVPWVCILELAQSLFPPRLQFQKTLPGKEWPFSHFKSISSLTRCDVRLPGTMTGLSIRKMTSKWCLILSPHACVGDLCGQRENCGYVGVQSERVMRLEMNRKMKMRIPLFVREGFLSGEWIYLEWSNCSLVNGGWVDKPCPAVLWSKGHLSFSKIKGILGKMSLFFPFRVPILFFLLWWFSIHPSDTSLQF